MASRTTHPKTSFPPLCREDFDQYYDNAVDNGVDAHEVTQWLIKDFLTRGQMPPEEADKLATTILLPKADLWVQDDDRRLNPEILEPVRKALVSLTQPPSSNLQEMREAVQLRRGIERLETITEIDGSQGLYPTEQRLLAVLVAAHEMNRLEGSYKSQRINTNKERNNTDRGMN